jgi:hypothetical protein
MAVPLERPSWTVDPREWLDSVRERWPAATGELIEGPDQVTVAVAVLPGQGGRLDVELRRDLCTVAFEPLLPEPIAEFVEWWVTRLPANEPPVHLFLLSNADRSLPLTTGLTAAQVRQFIAG